MGPMSYEAMPFGLFFSMKGTGEREPSVPGTHFVYIILI